MHVVLDYLRAGNPAHYLYLVAAGILVFEDGISRSKLAANSTVQLVFGLLGKLPVVGGILGVLGPKRAVALDGVVVNPEGSQR